MDIVNVVFNPLLSRTADEGEQGFLMSRGRPVSPSLRNKHLNPFEFHDTIGIEFLLSLLFCVILATNR